MSDLGQIRDAQVAKTCENLDFAILIDFDHENMILGSRNLWFNCCNEIEANI